MSDVMTKEAEESMRRIAALTKLHDKARNDLDEAEADVRIKRKQVEKLREQVLAAIREETQPSLFSPGVVVSDEDIAAAHAEMNAKAKAEQEAEAAKQQPTATEAAAATEAPAAGGSTAGEEWRPTPVEALELPDKTVKALAANDPPITTVGGLNDWTVSGKKFVEIKGISKTAGKKIDDAIVTFFEKRNAPTEAEETVAAEPAPDAEAQPAEAEQETVTSEAA